jgi:hypothetical protein
MEPEQGNPVHQHSDGKWYFQQEDPSLFDEGPFDTELQAKEALRRYYMKLLAKECYSALRKNIYWFASGVILVLLGMFLVMYFDNPKSIVIIGMVITWFGVGLICVTTFRRRRIIK